MPSSQRISCFSSTSRDALNYCHLVDAGLPALLDKYIAECLHRGQNDWLTKDFTRCVLQSHSTLVDLTLFLSDALNGESIGSHKKAMELFPLFHRQRSLSATGSLAPPALPSMVDSFTPNIAPQTDGSGNAREQAQQQPDATEPVPTAHHRTIECAAFSLFWPPPALLSPKKDCICFVYHEGRRVANS
jgi:hypothetical protein